MKLVISDADRTLLCRENIINAPLFTKMLRMLAHRAIPTVIASGRTHGELLRLFSPHERHLVYIALDGALMMADNTLLHAAPLPGETVSAARSLLSLDTTRGMLFCTKDAVYCITDDKSLLHTQKKRLGDALTVLSEDNVSALSDVPIYKICVFTKKGHTPPAAPCGARTVYKNSEMTEFIRADVNKFSALSVLCEALCIDIKDVLAYGDGENDRELLIGVRDGGGVAVTVYGAAHDIFSITPYHTQNVCASVLSFLSEDEKNKRMQKR